jgi:5-methylcytosine-specific restriction endonuclease McrA
MNFTLVDELITSYIMGKSTLKKSFNVYHRMAYTLDVEELLTFLDDSRLTPRGMNKGPNTPEFDQFVIDHFAEVRIHQYSLRYRTFHNSLVCVKCGRVGNLMGLEKACRDKHHTYHFNLYCVEGDIQIQMTKDHIIPKSRGGKDRIENMQTMCATCNRNKGNKING